MDDIKKIINQLYDNEIQYDEKTFKPIFDEFLFLLDKGLIRAAEPQSNGTWAVNTWIKKGILLLFKYGKLKDISINHNFRYFDKDTIPLRSIDINDQIRLVPGGSSIRKGTFIAKGVICMPPMYINIGAYVDEGSMIDSHALVGTCAQIGKRVHLSAASQIGGVLEPANARPVIVEDDVMIGGNCGIYEGVLIRKRVVLASGVILTASTRVFDVVNESVISSTINSDNNRKDDLNSDIPLEIPENAVVVPGSRGIKGNFAQSHGLSIYTPIIIKYRDSKTDAKTALNDILRNR